MVKEKKRLILPRRSIIKKSDSTYLINDNTNFFESKEIIKGNKVFPLKSNKIRTEISAGYDLTVDNKGRSKLGETIFKKRHNQMVLGGSLFVLEKVFGVASDLHVDYLNNIYNIGNTGDNITEIYPKDNVVCLFNVGKNAWGDSYKDSIKVLQQERELRGMIPFRVVDQPLTGEEKQKYWGAKKNKLGKTEYYFKAFESTPKIRVLWKDAGEDEDGSPVTDDVHLSTRNELIETFVEIVLRINKKDLMEYYQLNDEIDYARFNTIGLLSGIKSILEDGTEEYKQVKQITVLNFANEMLHMKKDISIIYRIYTS